MPSETRPEYLERKRKEVVEECMKRNVGTHSDAKEILNQYPEMLYFEENTHPGRTFEYRIVVRSPFVGVHSKTDKEVCDHVDPVVAMLKEFYNPSRVHVVVSSTVPSICKGSHHLHEHSPDSDDTRLSRTGRPTYDSLKSSSRASGTDFKSSSRRPRDRSRDNYDGTGMSQFGTGRKSDGGSKSRRTRRRKHNRKTHHKHARKTHHKRKHHSRSRSHSRAARKHKKYSRRH